MNSPSITYVIHCAATPEKVWEALTSPAALTKYWGKIESTWTVGSKVTEVDDSGKVLWKGEVLRCEPPRLLSFTFDVTGRGEPPTEVISFGSHQEVEAEELGKLDRTRRQLAARRVRIPAAADTQDRRLRDLPGDIALKPGELRIEFYGAEDLAAKLFELSEAMAKDWAAFARAAEDTALPAPGE